MAIRGNIADAALADVVQLLALGRRTGRLSAARDGELGTLWFVDGHVAHARLAHRRDPLGAALVRAGAIDDADLRAALVEQAAEPDTPLGFLLLRRGCVPSDALRAHVTAVAEEAAYELLGWCRGTFSFDVDVAPVAEPLRLRLDVGSLLLESARRADEGVLIATEVPGLSSVFARVPGDPGPQLGLAEDSTNEAARVASVLDGRMDVEGVADATGLSTFHAARAICQLVKRGHARRVASPATDAESPRHTGPRADEHLNLGVAFARSGLLDEAMRELRRALEFRPTDARARGHLGAVALRAGRIEEAAAVLGEAAALPGVSAGAVHALGVARHRLGQLELADAAYARAAGMGLADDPRHLTARAALALDRRAWGNARQWVERARIRWADVPPAIWYHYAVLAALGVGDEQGAATLLREGRAAHPRAAALLANSAALAAEGRQPAGSRVAALADVMGALAECEHMAPARRLLADLYYRESRFDDARRAYAAATELAPDASSTAWARLGSLAFRAGDTASAAHAWERACSLHPDHPTARANLAALRRTEAAAARTP